LTAQQVVGLGAAVSAAVTAALVSAASGGAGIPSAITIVAGCVSAGFGAAAIFMGNPAQMTRSLIAHVGPARAHKLVDDHTPH